MVLFASQADWEEEDFYDDYYDDDDDDDHHAGGGSQGGRAYMAALNNATHRLVLAGVYRGRAHMCVYKCIVSVLTKRTIITQRAAARKIWAR